MLFEESPTGSVPLQDRLKPKGYLKNKKQPAHLENKVQTAFYRANHALTHVFRQPLKSMRVKH